MSFEEFEQRNRRDTSSRLPCAMLVMCVGDGEIHVVCGWRYINERWSRVLDGNQLTGTIPTELGELTYLYVLYVSFTLRHLFVPRTVLRLFCALCPFDVLFTFPPKVSLFC